MCSECTSTLVFNGVLLLSVVFLILQSIRREAPKIGGSFAVWGGLFSTFDCTLVALRKKVQDLHQQSAQQTACITLPMAMHGRQQGHTMTHTSGPD